MTRLYVEENHALQLINIAIAFRSGSALDPIGKEGLSRLTTRMLRRGCKDHTSEQIEETIDSLGAEFAADVSSSIITLHADVIGRSLESLVKLLSQMIGQPTFDAKEFGRLQRETRGELLEALDNDRALVVRGFRSALFGAHPYGRRTGGTAESIANITIEDVQAQYRRHFCKSNALIAFSGAISASRAAEVAEQLLAGLPEGSPPLPQLPPPETESGRRLCFVDKPDRTQTQIMIGGLGSHPRDDDHIALHVATTIFGGTFTSRLMREVRSKKGWSYGASARIPYDRERDAFTMWTFPAAKDAAACIKLELDLLRQWHEQGITARELAFVKKYMVRSHAFDLDTPQKRVHMKLDVDLFDLPKDYHTTYLDRVQAVTEQSAHDAILRRISLENQVIAVVGTYAEIGAAIADAIGDNHTTRVVAYDADSTEGAAPPLLPNSSR